MNKPTNMTFSNGATWARADFHLHTIKEPGASRKKYRKEFHGREDEFCGEFIKKLKSEEIEIAAITNHNFFDLDEYKALAKRGRKENILILPGIEVGIRGGDSTIHTLIIFNPQNLSSQNDFINRFLNTQFPTGNPNEGDATSGDIPRCLESLEQLGESYFIIFAHAESDNGLLKENKKTALNPIYNNIQAIWDKRVLGFQGIKSSDKNYITQKLPDNMQIPAYVEGSDPIASINEVGEKNKGICYLKLSELSYHSVRFSLKDHSLRVRREKATPLKRPRISCIEVEGGKRKYAGYFLSNNLNTLIGSRGSGKSLMIEALRWCLNLKPGEGDQKYKKDLIHAFLDKGATVKVKGYTKEGKEFIVSRSYTAKKEQPDPEVFISGQKLSINVESVLPRILYFGQKDLGERDKESTDNIFEQILPPIPEEILKKSDTCKEHFEKSIDIYLTAKAANEQDDELKFEEQNLHLKLKTFKEAGVEEKLKNITSFDQDLRRLRKTYEELKKEISTIKSALITPNETPSWEDILQSQLTVDLKPELLELHTEYLSLKDDVELKVEKLNSILEKVGLIGAKLNLKFKEKQGSFAEVLREIDQPDLDIDEYRKMVSRLETIKETRKKTSEKKGKLNTFESDVISKGKKWHLSMQEVTDFYLSEINLINKRLPESINIHQDFQSDKHGFRSFLENSFRGTSFNEQSYDALVNGTSNGLELFIRRNQIIDSELTPAMGQKFMEHLEQNFKKILSYSSPDERLIEYNGTRISELSLGKRAMALLLLLLSLDTHPIIILDQPEDDLDNETIHQLIVKPLVHHKDNVQFIIATHNPNIPVLGDAEQVIACYENKRSEYSEEFGSIDMTETKNAIIDIMEGGTQAFEKRHDIYTLWAKNF